MHLGSSRDALQLTSKRSCRRIPLIIALLAIAAPRPGSPGAPGPPARSAVGPAPHAHPADPHELHLQQLRAQLAAVRQDLSRQDSSSGSSDSSSSSGGVDSSTGLEALRAAELQLRLGIAVALQSLNHLRPDGGSRVAEAEEHYRAALAASAPASPSHGGGAPAPAPLLPRLGVASNLAALLLEADRPGEALGVLGRALGEAEEDPGLGGSAPSLLCGLRFNRGKALASVGRTAEAEAAYAEAAQGAVGLDPACFAKSTAAMTRLPDSLAPLLLGAVQTAEETGLTEARLRSVTPPADNAPSRVGAAGALLGSLTPLSSPQHTPHDVDGNGGGGVGSGVGGGGGDGGVAFGGGGGGGVGDPRDGAFGDRSRGGWLAPLTAGELGWLYFAAAKRLEGEGAGAERVWAALRRANDLTSLSSPYDPAWDWRQLRTLTSVFGRPLLAAVEAAGGGLRRGAGGEGAAAGGGPGGPAGARADPADWARVDPAEVPIFVVGLPRSGSTLVETMLAALPGVWGAGEDTALAPLTGPLNDMLSTSGLAQMEQLEAFGRRYVSEMLQRSRAAGWGPQRPPRRIVDKMLRNLWLLGYIQLVLPHACLVHVVRHPLDAALSCYMQPFGYSGVPWAWRLDHIGEQVRMTAQLARHWAQALPPGRLLTLHYEELVAAPEASARRLLSHCGLPWDPSALAFHTANRTVSTASVAQVRQPLYKKAVGRWRQYERQLAGLAEQLRDEVAEYERTLAAAMAAAEAEQRRLDAAAAAAAAVAAAGKRGAAAGAREQAGDVGRAGVRAEGEGESGRREQGQPHEEL
ncbi:hypothetical protein HYH03_013417 [Edaphochlamys debaryana]|uniref:protein-tyrosine sulfotransferase n=1 Tax=Edaphochlamys debaryana TaxID=47281 RepID=A0A836BTC8_9CHLO|nr:hypothetical protein HYH03_013417 [Edaphochlamys debaryana]|eukprot:KAG2487977.1 hypothetical protein HYH03_013417 [Edaphochlamys debaryana]